MRSEPLQCISKCNRCSAARHQACLLGCAPLVKSSPDSKSTSALLHSQVGSFLSSHAGSLKSFSNKTKGHKAKIQAQPTSEVHGTYGFVL